MIDYDADFLALRERVAAEHPDLLPLYDASRAAVIGALERVRAEARKEAQRRASMRAILGAIMPEGRPEPVEPTDAEERAVVAFERAVRYKSEPYLLGPSMLDDEDVIRAARKQFRFIPPDRGWFLYSDLDEDRAREFGRRAFRSLIPIHRYPLGWPAPHKVPLWVGTREGTVVRVNPLP